MKVAEILSKHYQSEARDSLRVIGEELFFYGIDEHYFPAIENGKLILAEYYILIGRTTEGITMTKALLPNMQERMDNKQLCLAARSISLGYTLEKDAKSALYWAEKAVKYSKLSLDPNSKLNGLIGLAEAYLLKGEQKKAIETFQKYVVAAKPLENNRGMSSAFARLGDIYRLKGNLEKSKIFFEKSLNCALKANLITPIGHALNNIAILNFEQGDTVGARLNFERAMNMRLKANDHRSISESYYNMGDYHYYIEKNDLAIRWYTKSLNYAKEHRLKNEQIDALKALAEISKSSLDYKGATAYLEQSMQIDDAIKIQERNDEEEIVSMQMSILRLEAEEGITNDLKQNEKGFWKSIRWEWLVILLLLVFLFMRFKTKDKASEIATH